MQLVILGELVELLYQEPAGKLKRFQRKDKQGQLVDSLAYSPTDRQLHVVQVGSEEALPGSEELSQFWREFHWEDERQPVSWVKVSVPQSPPTKKMGEVRAVTYRTSKGGDEFDWVHWFDQRPQMWQDDCSGVHLLGVVKVNSRGIVS